MDKFKTEFPIKSLKLLTVLFVFSQLLACAQPHNLTPLYNQESKTLSIDSLSLHPVSYVKEKEGRFGGLYGARTDITLFKFDNEVCNSLQVEQVNPDPNVYLTYSAKDFIMIEHNDKCLTRKIDNIHSLRCMNKSDADADFYMTSSIQKNIGYGRQITYYFVNNECLKKFEEHFTNKAEASKSGLYETNQLDLRSEVFLKNLLNQ